MNITLDKNSNTIYFKFLNKLTNKNKRRLGLHLQAMEGLELFKKEENNNEIIIKISDSNLYNNILSLFNFLTELNLDFTTNKDFQTILKYRQSEKEKHAQRTKNLKLLDCNDGIAKEFNSYSKKILNVNLKDYQYESALRLIKGRGGFDFSVPGSGKTIIAYSAYGFIRDVRRSSEKLFVIGPKNASYAWYDEYKLTFGVDPDFMDLSNDSLENTKEYFERSGVYISEITFINFDKLYGARNQIINFLSNYNVVFIVDEGHKVKNPKAKVTKACINISKYAATKILLTGTPMPNGYEDLYPLTKIYSPDFEILPFKYGKLRYFTENSISIKDEKKIMNAIKPFFSRISKVKLIHEGELPKANHKYINIDMDYNQNFIDEFLDKMYENFKSRFEEKLSLMFMRALLIRKMQISANPGLLKTSILSYFNENKEDFIDSISTDIQGNTKSNIDKIQDFDQIVVKEFLSSELGTIINKYNRGQLVTNKNKAVIELAKNFVLKKQKIIIWDVFVDNMNLIYTLIKNNVTDKVELVNGTITGESRNHALINFKEGNTLVLIASPATLAESISLHKACQNAIYLNRNFNAAEFIQSKDRIHRINMPYLTTANYFYLGNKDSIDEKIDERLNIKEKRMLKILDADEIGIGAMESTENSNATLEDIESVFGNDSV
jgi:hypothetical protein